MSHRVTMKHTQKKLEEQLNYMYGLERFGIKLGLEVMEALLDELGNPQQKFPSIHITGTSGKGSVAAMVESVLRTAGRKTALYTSPHLFTFNERIRVNNVPISDVELGSLIEIVKTAADRTGLQPTFFEFTTAIAFLYFAQHTPDMAIIEVGMGGILDATNVIMPKVSVITTIDLDHMPFIGRNKQEIAANKAGIIKTSVPVVTGDQDPDIIEYLKSVCHERNTYLRVARDEVRIKVVSQNYTHQRFTLNGREYVLTLLGRHQQSNAATAVLILEELGKQGVTIPEDAIRQGLAATQWLGRLTVVSEKPFILVDGAHNRQSLEALYGFLTDPATRPPSFDVLVVGVKKDKDISLIRDTIAPLFKQVITTQGSYEPMPVDQLAEALKFSAGGLPAELAGGGRIEVMKDPQKATQRGLKIIGNDGSLVITGSLYMIPPALTYLREKLST